MSILGYDIIGLEFIIFIKLLQILEGSLIAIT